VVDVSKESDLPGVSVIVWGDSAIARRHVNGDRKCPIVIGKRVAELTPYVDEFILVVDVEGLHNHYNWCLDEWKNDMGDVPFTFIATNGEREIRSLNRAMRISKGRILVVIHAGDIIGNPVADWFPEGLKLMRTRSNLGILSAHYGIIYDYKSHEAIPYRFGSVRSGTPILFAAKNLPFMYTECAEGGILFLRRSLVDLVGGYDVSLERKTGPRSFFHNCIFSYDTWTNGYSAALYEASAVNSNWNNTLDVEFSPLEAQFRKATLDFSYVRYNRKYIHDYIIKLCERELKPRSNTTTARSTG